MADRNSIIEKVKALLSKTKENGCTDEEELSRLWSASDTQGVYTDITQPLSLVDSKRLDQQNTSYVLVDERLSGRSVPAHPEDRERLVRAPSIQVQRII
jgi:hypothetical protein